MANRLGLNSQTLALLAALFLVGLGEELWSPYLPKYLDALGASLLVIGLWSAGKNLLEGFLYRGGGELSNRLRASQDYVGYEPEAKHERPPDSNATLGAATQIEIESGHVSFLVPFIGQWPNEYWLQAFRRAQVVWPSHLVEPRLDHGRGVQVGPLPAHELEAHVRALKERVAAANGIYTDEIEPELRRQREEALRREQEHERLQAEVASKLKHLLG
jgi:hypothetical protein